MNEMESRAIGRYLSVTPQKTRRVVDLIRGKRAGDALISLRFMPYRAAGIVEKVLKSAMANAEQKKAKDAENMIITKAYVDEGPAMKRMLPRAMGRTNIIKKRTSHITLYLEGD